MRRRTAWMLVVLCSVAAGQGSFMGTVQGDKVRVRGGPADFHVVLGYVKRGTPVRVVGSDGDWKKVEVPGGFPVFVSMGKKDRPYLQEGQPGEGLVLVNDLMIRGTASTDFPPIGRLRVGDRVVILGKTAGWARLASPSGSEAWIHGKYVARASDQRATQAAWTAQHEASRRALLETGENSKALLARRAEQEARRKTTEAAFERFQTELEKPWDQRDVEGVRSALAQVRDAHGENDVNRLRAVSMLSTVDEWERAGGELRRARARLAEAQRAAADADARFQKDMNAIKGELDRKAREAAAPKAPPPARGTVARVFPVEGLRRGPAWGIAIGRKHIYRLAGDRYDWADYEGKLIVVLQSDEAPKQSGVSEPILNVRRIEILDG